MIVDRLWESVAPYDQKRGCVFNLTRYIILRTREISNRTPISVQTDYLPRRRRFKPNQN